MDRVLHQAHLRIDRKSLDKRHALRTKTTALLTDIEAHDTSLKFLRLPALTLTVYSVVCSFPHAFSLLLFN
jgi:hypothetical protein